MHYITQTITIQHRIIADEAITEEIREQIKAEVRGLLHGKGNKLVYNCGYSLNAQGARNEEAEASIRVTIENEEITELEVEPVNA